MTVSYYINESYFLYNKIDLIKETFITALNKKVSIYGSISLIIIIIKKKTTENRIFKIITPEKFSKFYVEKNTTKDSLSFQLTNISRKLPRLKTKKITIFP